MQQSLALRFDPQIHGIGKDQLRPRHLFQHTQLQLGARIAQENVRQFPVNCRQSRIEIRQHVQMDFQRIAVIHVGVIPSPPVKRLATTTNLQATQINTPLAELFEMFGRKILTDHSHQMDFGKQTGGV
ncbi:hypothetical protein HRbin36_00845 [bacterium HR36]|nr:hypothetical protein HRbin36_00845 [bacterium HR36]